MGLPCWGGGGDSGGGYNMKTAVGILYFVQPVVRTMLGMQFNPFLHLLTDFGTLILSNQEKNIMPLLLLVTICNLLPKGEKQLQHI